MSSGEDEAVLALVRAHQARRRFDLTLEQLCLQQVARQEQLYVIHPGHSALLAKLPPLLKCRVLEELPIKVSENLMVWRYPAGEHRMSFVKQLINSRLESFDFAVCNVYGDDEEEQIYRCLVQRAGGTLKSITDLRGTVRDREFNLGWRLPLIAQFPNLETFKMTFSCCVKGELKELLDAAPKLKILHLNLIDVLDPLERDSLFKQKSLEELDLSHSVHSALEHLIHTLLQLMPQLKINGISSHELMHRYESTERFFHHHQDREESINHQYQLEHISVALGKVFENNGCFSNVKNVKISEADGGYDGLDYSELFSQMRTLNMRYYLFGGMVPTLVKSGAMITTLILDCLNEEPDHPTYLQLVFACCPRLTSLTVRGGGETEDNSEAWFLKPEKHLLREMNLQSLGVKNVEFLPWVLRTPMLEKLSLVNCGWEPKTFELAASALKEGRTHLANLHTFEFNYPKLDDFRHSYEAVEPFVNSVLSSSPSLRQAHVDLEREDLNLKLKPLLKLINE